MIAWLARLLTDAAGSRALILGLAAAWLLTVAALVGMRVSRDHALTGKAVAEKALAEYRAQAAQTALQAAQRARTIEDSLRASIEAQRSEYEARQVDLELAQRRAAVAGSRLRDVATQLAAAGHCPAAANPGANARTDAPGTGAAGRLADMVGRLDQFAEQASTAADRCAVALNGLRGYAAAVSGTH